MARRGYPVTFKYMIPENVSDETKEDVANFIKEQVLQDISNQTSSVNGRQWKSLSPGYAEFKATISGEAVANLELYGDMLDSFDYRIGDNYIEIGIFGDELQKAKAENHNYGVTLPKRQFIPGENENFRPGISGEAQNILIASGELENVSERRFIEQRVTQDVLRNLIQPELFNE